MYAVVHNELTGGDVEIYVSAWKWRKLEFRRWRERAFEVAEESLPLHNFTQGWRWLILFSFMHNSLMSIS